MSTPEPTERVKITSVRKNSRETLHVDLLRMEDGRWRFSARLWFVNEQGQPAPGRSGFTMPAEALPELSPALQEALREARDRGILE